VPSFEELHHRLAECTRRLMRDGRRLLAEARLQLDGELARGTQALRDQLARRRRALDGDARRLAGLHPRARLHRDRAALAQLGHRLTQLATQRLPRERARLVELRQRLGLRAHQLLDGRKRNLALAAGRLDALSPLAVLQRGYALARRSDGHVVTDAADVQPGDTLEVKLARGRLDCRVQSVEPEGADD
jgi:exodeoxyribonuclease VII large subunit